MIIMIIKMITIIEIADNSILSTALAEEKNRK